MYFGGASIAAAVFQDPGSTRYWIRPSHPGRTDQLMDKQETLQGYDSDTLKPTVGQEYRFVVPGAKPRNTTRIPRPMNAYMLYRADRHANIMAMVQQQRPGDSRNNARVCKLSVCKFFFFFTCRN